MRSDKNALLHGKLGSIFTNRIVLLDAGLGTTLEDVLHKDISHPLWSAHLIDSDPEAILEAHLAFLRAGSSIILTATYQCAPGTFQRAGYKSQKGNDIMHKAVRLAVQARDQFGYTLTTDRPKIALSLGPYGAILSPAAEFSGIYPPPYGPQSGTFFDVQEPTGNLLEQEAEDALVEFHLNRLRIYSSLSDTWDSIDIIAFETVPLLREAKAIRRAMTLFTNTNPYIRVPAWWISFNFAEGVLAEQNSTGNHYSAADAVRACFEQPNGLPLCTPLAFGINCTPTKHLKGCLQQASEALGSLSESATYASSSHRSSQSQFGLEENTGAGPSLVLYPNGGRVYVPSSMTWLPPSPTIPELDNLSEAQIWAKKVVAAVLESVPQNAGWGGLIIGGCCKTEPEHLNALKDLL